MKRFFRKRHKYKVFYAESTPARVFREIGWNEQGDSQLPLFGNSQGEHLVDNLYFQE
jgi:hypothetical protein